ncbi:GspL/Epsl periplasmic domain-containing protein, partial [Hylemonella sp. W303a]|uniref:GspL/Epsl periplasmic domain-containing protein n=1 Tax=Hylemonella sp. W303a TaxID=3389873 RepID=UPI00396B3829
RAWLTACLSALRAAGRPATRICPAFPPLVDASASLLWVSAETGSPWLHIAGPEGVVGLPLSAYTATDGLLASLLSAAQGQDGAESPSASNCTATPDAMASAQTSLPDLPWRTETMTQQWLRGVNSGWDLAQFDLRDAMGARRGQALLEWLRPLWQAPRWRPLRWGLVALFAVQVAGLHLLAWQERSQLRQLRMDTQRVATQTFPQLSVVLDAPRQMQRELDALRHGAGELGPADLESLLHALGADPALSGLQMDSLRYTPRETRLRHAPGAPLREALTAAATRQGWIVQPGSSGTSGQTDSVLKRN